MRRLAALAVWFASIAAGFSAERDLEWDQVFQRTSGWTGGDAVYAVDLPDDRILWIFADSWIGAIVDGKHAPGSKLINNAIAVHQRGEREKIRFFPDALPEKGEPKSWIVPDTEVVEAPKGKHWYWPADGAVGEMPDGERRLVIFLWHMGRASEEDKGVWNFKSLGGAVAIIDNMSESPERWKVRQARVPEGITWGAEVHAEGKWFHVFGTRDVGNPRRNMVMARVPVAKVDDPKAWEFRTKDGWSRKIEDATSIADGVPSEFSVSRHGSQWVLVQSELLLGGGIRVRTTEEFPFPPGQGRLVFRPGELKDDKDRFAYAAKAHPEVSGENDLLISYVVNSHDFWKMVGDAEIYRPRFIRVLRIQGSGH